ncbi:xanthine dehydrogenase family protein molybdopterin-binding subunit [Sphingomonas crusticola]|uniref:xanthine dehydrogenase family protein molybdopterin-binding subunit n=1 Tax=Sphingomonas crusticola TaxID=1697973 RepID=UPI000E224283|nr:molybdopterin cofactor-binding domain-containing protein [Sphingomonas crusticola]
MAAADITDKGLDRRTLLIGGGLGVGLLLAWELWPRDYPANVAAAPGETVMGAFLKIDTAGRVTVIVPQAEMGQGIWTALPQALADELGADWRQVGVEPAPISPLYANRLIAGDYGEAHVPHFLRGVGRWAAGEWATRNALMITAGSTSIRAFERPFRDAGAFARALLCMAAGKRLGVDWQACDTEAGFVVRGDDRFRFGELAAEAAGFTPPVKAPLRKPGEGNISGKSMPRLDLPSKVDGSARFAGDVRLPNMLFASVRHGPLGDTRLVGEDVAAADTVWGVSAVVRGDGWVAALANNWWAADHALDKMRPRFATGGTLPDSAGVARALDTALGGAGETLVSVGKAGEAFSGPGLIDAVYAVPLQAHATIEPLVATARVDGDRLEVWVPTQAPGLARAAVAAATGFGNVIVYPTLVGGGFGRKLENDAAVQAATLAIRAKRPVQVMWSRGEEMRRGRHGAPAKARLTARLGARGEIAAWRARIATGAGDGVRRLTGHGSSSDGHAMVDGALPPYAIPAVAIEHAAADIGIESGVWRSGAHSYTAFFTESFVDELAAHRGKDMLAFREAMLAHAPRLAHCLAAAAGAGGWSGKTHAGEGLACHSAFGSHIALYVQAAHEGGRIKVARMVAAVDAGRLINPDIVRQQIESGLVWGLASALGDDITFTRGLPDQVSFDSLSLPRLKDIPDIHVEMVASHEAPGGVAELGVPVVAPAIANAIFSATGKRLRSLPLSLA